MIERYMVGASLLVENAQFNPSVGWLINYELRGGGNVFLKFLRRLNGGIEVGGWLELLPDKLLFRPSALNNDIFDKVSEVEVYYSQIKSLTVQQGFLFGFFADRLQIALDSQTVKFRCRRARSVVRRIKSEEFGSE